MAKKSKDATASTAKKEAKAKDPVATKNLTHLLNIIALVLAITAFFLQLYAVKTHHWKHLVTNLRPILSPDDHPSQTNVHDDSQIVQNYGLFSRNVKVLANNDEQLHVHASTRFPKLVNNNDDDLHQCLSHSSTLRGSFLTCAKQFSPPKECHCRRYPHWNAIIFFEIAALILLGLAIVVSALLTTQYHNLLKLIGIALSFIAFLFLFLGLILLLSYLKRETRTIADLYPHTHTRISNQVSQHHPTVLHQAVRRQAHETYRAYPLLPGQHPYNETHYQEYSEKEGAWVHKPYSGLKVPAYAPRQQGGTQLVTTEAPKYNAYGPLLSYHQVYENTHACIGWSAILSIIALVLSLILAGLLAFSWLTGKKSGPEVTTVTTTTVKTEYVPVPQDVTVETIPLTRPVHTETA